jgi:hypothetical protein
MKRCRLKRSNFQIINKTWEELEEDLVQKKFFIGEKN